MVFDHLIFVNLFSRADKLAIAKYFEKCSSNRLTTSKNCEVNDICLKLMIMIRKIVQLDVKKEVIQRLAGF